jgi:outer membrane protein OmpA-like peptidoglycan-associated protein
MRLGFVAALLALAGALGSRSAAAQAGGAIERFEPAPAGDAMFGVPSPAVGGHLVPRATAIFDFAYEPLSITDGKSRVAIVSQQAFLHLDASFALWDRLLISADMPFALVQGGDSPTVAGVDFSSPSGAQVGDLRLGARGRIWGAYWDPFQIGVGGYVFLPTAPKGSYAGDGSTRGEPQLLLGGRLTHFVWSASLGATLKTSEHPHTFNAGAGAALVLGEEFFQIGPELTLATPFSQDDSFSSATTKITVATPTAAELFFGAKIRPLRAFVIGAGAGPGLTNGLGTPKVFAVATLGYAPLPPRTADTDHDGVPDTEDACPTVPGVRDPDPKKNGCPPDRDGDGIPDVEDACPDVKGVRDADPKKNGCPPEVPDRDHDGVPDAEDACPDVKGVRDPDPKKNGCPPEAPDRDHDGVPDAEDACPDVKGVRDPDPKKNGCPRDRDGDGIPDAEDACPDVKGSPDPDPKKNGCPHVQVTETEIEISSQVRFLYAKSRIDQTVDPVSEGLLNEVKDAIDHHPEIEHIEIQGHTDKMGSADFNQKLSEARADAVREWLVQRGIPARKLTSKGFGFKKPIASNDSEAGRQANRRVQFIIVKRRGR